MEKFTIIEKVAIKERDLYLLNMPFSQRKKEDGFRGSILHNDRSSYHDAEQNEPDWLIYPSLMKCNINIVSCSENYTHGEALAYTGMNNGFGLTRDNLFMVPALFPAALINVINLYAFMPLALLPVHLNGPKICPMLSIRDRENPLDKLRFNYDWYWVEEEKKIFDVKDQFIFFTPYTHKSH